MNATIESAVKILAKKTETCDPHDAMQFAQAALNLAHALATLEGIKQAAK